MTNNKPSQWDAKQIYVFAGPNGSGKSTIVDRFRQSGMCPLDFICPDQLVPHDKKNDKNAYIKAMQVAELTRINQVVLGNSFSFETVLSREEKLKFIKDAREASNYDITVIYVVTSDFNINLKRIAERVQQGGHDVPPDKVISRYKKSMDLMFDVIMSANKAMVFDNSSDKPKTIFEKTNINIDNEEKYICYDCSPLIDVYIKEKARVHGITISDLSSLY